MPLWHCAAFLSFPLIILVCPAASIHNIERLFKGSDGIFAEAEEGTIQVHVEVMKVVIEI